MFFTHWHTWSRRALDANAFVIKPSLERTKRSPFCLLPNSGFGVRKAVLSTKSALTIFKYF